MLLNDKAVAEFIRQGYTLVQSDLGADFHRDICKRLDPVIGQEGNPGNNILPRIPQIQQVFDCAPVRGALQSLLGPDYAIHPHRYCHLNKSGSPGQNWHKDDYIFDQQTRHHRNRWVMAFYYPQDVTPDMGASGVMPGRQYHNGISNSDPALSAEEELKLCGPAGTVALLNFDVWHRATANTSNKSRYMLKFQFTRMAEPLAPSWDNQNDSWHTTDGVRDAVGAHVWDWLSGKTDTNANQAKGDIDRLLTALGDKDEDRRIEAAYALGACGTGAVPGLMNVLETQVAMQAEANLGQTPANVQGGNPAELSAAYALAAVGQGAVAQLASTLQHGHWGMRAAAADILGNIGRPAKTAVPQLAQALSDGDFWVRRNAAQALGTIAPQDEEVVAGLAKNLQDSDERLRRNAAFSLAKIGPGAASAVDGLRQTLADESRYVRFNTVLALKRIATPQAQEALWEELVTSRWCPVTTSATPY
jgi:hypothetical protein